MHGGFALILIHDFFISLLVGQKLQANDNMTLSLAATSRYNGLAGGKGRGRVRMCA